MAPAPEHKTDIINQSACIDTNVNRFQNLTKKYYLARSAFHSQAVKLKVYNDIAEKIM